MNINTQAKHMDLTEAIRDYVENKNSNLLKLLEELEKKGGVAEVRFVVARTTNHHKSGDVFEADCSIYVHGENFYAKAHGEDLYAAVDEVREKLFNEIGRNKDRKQTLFHRGARSVKKMMKGLSKRNPFTSKY